LGCRCPNCQCEGIFDIYVSRPFQWNQEQPNARCLAPCCRALNIRESRRTPNPQLFQVLGFTPTLGQVRVATFDPWNCSLKFLGWLGFHFPKWELPWECEGSHSLILPHTFLHSRECVMWLLGFFLARTLVDSLLWLSGSHLARTLTSPLPWLQAHG
jgi:hypothetical protein